MTIFQIITFRFIAALIEAKRRKYTSLNRVIFVKYISQKKNKIKTRNEAKLNITV